VVSWYWWVYIFYVILRGNLAGRKYAPAGAGWGGGGEEERGRGEGRGERRAMRRIMRSNDNRRMIMMIE
jgi:hypothetical protein